MAVPAVTAFFFWNRELLSEGDLNCCQVSITIRDSETSGDHLRESVFFGHSPVAQLVEQAAVNRLVVGSSPTGGACSHLMVRAALDDAPFAPAIFFGNERREDSIQRFPSVGVPVAQNGC